MQHLIEFLLTHFVEHPADLSVEEIDDDYRKTYLVRAHPEDMGLIIGHRGQTIKAVRQVASILAKERNERFTIKVEEAEV
jgi:hypothetical protein